MKYNHCSRNPASFCINTLHHFSTIWILSHLLSVIYNNPVFLRFQLYWNSITRESTLYSYLMQIPYASSKQLSVGDEKPCHIEKWWGEKAISPSKTSNMHCMDGCFFYFMFAVLLPELPNLHCQLKILVWACNDLHLSSRKPLYCIPWATLGIASIISLCRSVVCRDPECECI